MGSHLFFGFTLATAFCTDRIFNQTLLPLYNYHFAHTQTELIEIYFSGYNLTFAVEGSEEIAVQQTYEQLSWLNISQLLPGIRPESAVIQSINVTSDMRFTYAAISEGGEGVILRGSLPQQQLELSQNFAFRLNSSEALSCTYNKRRG